MFEQMKEDPIEMVLHEVYREVLKMSPALCTNYTTRPASKLGDSVRMVDGKVLILDRRIMVKGFDTNEIVRKIVEPMRPSFGFMANTHHFVAQVTDWWRDEPSYQYGVVVIWGVA